MKREQAILSLIVVSLWLGAACATPQGGQERKVAGSTVDNSQQRKQRILANLSNTYPKLSSLNPELGDIERITPGMESVAMTIHTAEGKREQTLLLLPDDSALYMVMDGPIDVSRSAEAIQKERSQARRKLRKKLAKLVQGAPVRGAPQAPVTVVIFSDFQCPYCKLGGQTLDRLLEKFPTQVNLAFVHYPLSFHPWAMPASIAAECALQQDPKAFWILHDGLFAAQEELTSDNLVERGTALLAQSGIDIDLWKTCSSDAGSAGYRTAKASIDAGMSQGRELGVDGVPGFFIGGEFIGGAVPLAEFERATQQALAEGGQ